MEYIIIESKNVAQLVFRINELIECGWQPLGGVCHGANNYIQAMTRSTRAKNIKISVINK